MSAGKSWRVDRLVLENFRCFDELDIAFDDSFTALVGVNGAGKTAILDALAVMLSTVLYELGDSRRGFSPSDVRLVSTVGSSSSVSSMEPAFPVTGAIDATLAGSEYWWKRVKASRSGRTSWGDKRLIDNHVSKIWRAASSDAPTAQLPVIAMYGVERLVGVRRAQGRIQRSRSDAYAAALDSKSDLTRLSAYIQGLTLDEYTASTELGNSDSPESRQLAAIRLSCERILATTGWTGPYWRQNVGELTMIHSDHGELPLSFLSSGLKITAGLAIDLASRMARANPTLGGTELLETVPGIVLIDEVDLHLHPTWQQRIVPSLRTTFPQVQFIVTTHSPQVLSTVPAQGVRILDSTTVGRIQHSEGLRSDVILREILGTEPQPEVELTQRLRRYLELVDAGKGLDEEAKKMRQDLDNELGGANLVPALADADAAMTFYDLDDE
ncbi:AAA family ATPase (plasmid) [Rhodococcus pyridinivorans]|uniref:AAA family ATPase n=1 Tax=Rhodococcus pyridinivorans TaxID=103816 RepID=UPI0021649E23|nr:AAA family ATPase [Rhodococcus pyridinivorans]UVT27714.1 AAA family ATPase [Rhodococcus pyridinivorans]